MPRNTYPDLRNTNTGGNSERRLTDSKIARIKRQHVKGLEGVKKFQCCVAFSECAGVGEGAGAGGGAHQVRPRQVVTQQYQKLLTRTKEDVPLRNHLAVLRIRDVYPGSRVKIPDSDPNQRI